MQLLDHGLTACTGLPSPVKALYQVLHWLARGVVQGEVARGLVMVRTDTRPPPQPPHTLLPSPHLQHHGDDIVAIENDGWDYLKVAAAIVTCGYASIAAFLAAKGRPQSTCGPALLLPPCCRLLGPGQKGFLGPPHQREDVGRKGEICFVSRS